MSLNSTISHEIADVLRNDILRQQYRSGERLPSERDLASHFEANRGAVREALSQLEQLGLIQIQPGGARVQAIDSASIALLGPLITMNEIPDPALVDQFLQTFGALASLNARESVANANAEQLQQLRDKLAELSQNSEDFEAMQLHWRELLDTMASIANNLVVRLIGNDLKAQFVEHMMSTGIKPEIKKRVINKVLSSLKLSLINQDGELAASAIQTHFDELRIAVSKAIQFRLTSYQKEAV
jgi:GntR family transcriptional repressor for pyruvate dehydrogenase complex